MSRIAYALIGFAIGYIYGKYRMLKADINEYHALRMDLREKLNEVD